MKITAKIARGKNTGTLLYPHLYEDGMYVVSKTRYVRDYIRLADLHGVAAHIANGYKVRMSNPKEGVAAASLIEPGAISVTA
jgi:hypothetical protein